MHTRNIMVAVAGVAAKLVDAQRPDNTSMCDYYTTALMTENTAENQYSLLKLMVNTVVIGNYTQPNVGIAVPGILAPGQHNGIDVNLLPYFTGELASSNRGGEAGVSVNFLDGGGPASLIKNMPADSETSNQYFLLTHLYQFFGALLGCTQYGIGPFPIYSGDGSMYDVHKFMDLGPAELGYFITQVGLTGASFGVAQSDLEAIDTAIQQLFGLRCAPPVTVIPTQGSQLQAICIQDACPLSSNATCDTYDPAAKPALTIGTNTTAMGSSMGSNSSTMSILPWATVTTASASATRVAIVTVYAIVGVLAAMVR